MLRIYEINGATYQFEEGTQPPNAKLCEPKAVDRPTESKQAPAMQNKARAPRTKSVMRDGR